MNGGITAPLILALTLYGSCCLALYLAQRHLVYFPTAESDNPMAQDIRIASIAQRRMPLFPVSLMIKDRYDSWRLAGELENKTLAGWSPWCLPSEPAAVAWPTG